MKKYCILMTAAALSIAFGASAFAQARDGEEAYPTPPEAKEKPGVKYGEWIRLPFENSQVYPGTRRDLNIYVPAEYDGKTPVRIEAVVVSAQHDEHVSQEQLIKDIKEFVIGEVIDKKYVDEHLDTMIRNRDLKKYVL